jgi:hypothetical protein
MVAPGLSIFFPCYNDARSIGALVEGADAVAAEFTADYKARLAPLATTPAP